MAVWLPDRTNTPMIKPTPAAQVLEPTVQGPLALELSPELAAAARQAARRRGISPEALLQELIEQALQGEQQRSRIYSRMKALTERERQVAQLAGRGCTNREIAAKLVISPETVKTHVRHILAKLDLENKLELRLLLGT
jgi:RNA polymerase sigma factor (sigma-70 family)